MRFYNQKPADLAYYRDIAQALSDVLTAVAEDPNTGRDQAIALLDNLHEALPRPSLAEFTVDEASATEGMLGHVDGYDCLHLIMKASASICYALNTATLEVGVFPAASVVPRFDLSYVFPIHGVDHNVTAVSCTRLEWLKDDAAVGPEDMPLGDSVPVDGDGDDSPTDDSGPSDEEVSSDEVIQGLSEGNLSAVGWDEFQRLPNHSIVTTGPGPVEVVATKVRKGRWRMAGEGVILSAAEAWEALDGDMQIVYLLGEA